MGKPELIAACVVLLVTSAATSAVSVAQASKVPTPSVEDRPPDRSGTHDRTPDSSGASDGPLDRSDAVVAPSAGDHRGRLGTLAGAPTRRDVVAGVEGGGDNFTDEVVLGSGLDDPIDLAFLPDGRLIVIQKEGQVWITGPDDGTTDKQLYLDIGARVDNSEFERGLAGIAIDPAFEQTGHVFLYYSNLSTGRNRIARFTHQENGGGLDSTADPSSETLIWEQKPPMDHCCHHGGGLDFGSDGKIYLTTGEDAGDDAAQNLSTTDGKVIRVNKDGSIPSTNPYVGDPDALDSIWASGLRNPFRASWDHERDRLLIGDVGGNEGEDPPPQMEEINVGEAGANYGWPTCQGECDEPGTKDPLYAYPHEDGDVTGNSITGGDVYDGDAFPGGYHGAYFFADFVDGWIRYLTFDDGAVDDVEPFVEDADWIVDVTVGPDGALYYVEHGIQGTTAQVHRVRYTGNTAPRIESVSADPTSGPEPLTVDFAAEANDPDDDALEYVWTFGDGSEGTGPEVSHTYEEGGVYEARLQVSDGDQTVAADPIQIEVGDPPEATIDEPADGTVADVGTNVTFSGSASDPEDGELAGEALQWEVGLVHDPPGPNDTHVHSAVSTNGTSGTFEVAAHGHENLSLIEYEVTLEATDSDGLTDSTAVTVVPNDLPTVNLTAEPDAVEAGETVALSANASDRIGDSLAYDWRIESAPSGASPALPSGASGDVTLAETGTYEFGVTVTDEHGANATDSVGVEATAANQSPSANFSWSPMEPVVDETVTFDASNSSDLDGNVTGYEWDFDGDGTFEAQGQQVDHAFDAAGNHSVTLRVTDDDGAEATRTRTVAVSNRTLSIAEAVASTNPDGNDSLIETEEIQQAISWWADDTPVPNTGGQVMDTSDIQQLISMWSRDTPVGETADN